MSDTTPIQAHRSEDATLAVVLHRVKAVEALCSRGIQQNDDIKAGLAKIDTALAVGAQRMDQVDQHLAATDKRVDGIESDRRSAAALWTGLGGFATAIGSFLYALFHRP